MSSSTLLSVFALFLICCVHQTEAQSGRVCVIRSRGNTNEDQGPVVFKLRRKQGTQGNVTVSYTLVDETTQPPDIMGERSGTVTFVDGQTMATISVKINDDDEQEDSEQFRIILSGDSIGAETSTSAIIADDDVYSPWGPWVGDCSVTCGPANKTETRNRTCISVRVERCVQTLNDSRIVDCNLTGCPS
ncbi:adhesion G-protein coupled receptor V1-like [Haliotis cracherodii]|uniref:adhesion G-protein coupled receptor V1-like n=1 Tax=Haliotis cracherodii TaxID=6455 RepID=UPI0039EA5900